MLTNKIVMAEVRMNREIAPGVYHLQMLVEKETAAAARPGQFLNVYPEAGSRLILPRPFGICSADPDAGTLEIVYEVVGRGTEILSAAGEGTLLKIAAPLGRGFDTESLKSLRTNDARPPVLIGGGVGCGPMLFLARTLQREQVPVTAVLGFRDRPFLVREFREAGCTLLTASETEQEGIFSGNVIDCMTAAGLSAPAYFACGPRGMLAAVDAYVSADCGDEFLQVSLEERMGCGYGVCVGCSTRIREYGENGQLQTVRRKICTDGPVFRGNEVIWDDGTR